MESKFKTQIGEIVIRIRQTRENLNYTQEYLAMKLNISQNAYSKTELGYIKLTLARLVEICAVLEVDVKDIIQPGTMQTVYRLVYNPSLQRRAV